jgi:hypothetical protein
VTVLPISTQHENSTIETRQTSVCILIRFPTLIPPSNPDQSLGDPWPVCQVLQLNNPATARRLTIVLQLLFLYSSNLLIMILVPLLRHRCECRQHIYIYHSI